jgi:hypothetical protein
MKNYAALGGTPALTGLTHSSYILTRTSHGSPPIKDIANNLKIGL